MTHVDDRPLLALVKKEAARTADLSSRSQSSSKPPKPKLTIPAKAPADPPRVAEAKHRQRSDSRHRRRHKAPSSFDFDDLAVSSNLSGSSGRLTLLLPLLLDYDHDRALVSTVAAATPSQVTNHAGTPSHMDPGDAVTCARDVIPPCYPYPHQNRLRCHLQSVLGCHSVYKVVRCPPRLMEAPRARNHPSRFL